MLLRLAVAAAVFLVLPRPALADSAADEPLGCAWLRMAQELHDAYIAQIDLTKDTAAAAESVMVRETRQFVCAGRHRKGATVDHANGKTGASSWNTPGSSMYWPNGKHFSTSLAAGGSFYWPNGKHLTTSMGKGGALYWPNGKHVTTTLGRGSSWYYAGGKHVSVSLGNSGATWYHTDGSHWTSDGPAIDADVLIDRPGCVLALAVAGTLPDAKSCPAVVKATGASDVKSVLAACEKAHATDAQILACIRAAAKR